MANLFFETKNQIEIFLDFLPKGKIYNQAKNTGSTFNNLIIWIADSLLELVERLNEAYKGLYICQSKNLLKNYMLDYSIPNEVFYKTNEINSIGKVFFGFNDIKPHHYSNVLYILLLSEEQGFPFEFPYVFGSGLRDKITKIYNIIKPAHTRIEYISPPADYVEAIKQYKLPLEIPSVINKEKIIEKIYKEFKIPKKIEFCENLYK